MRNNGRGNPRDIRRKFAVARMAVADPAEDVLRAIENNGEVTLPNVADHFGLMRRRYRLVVIALMAAYFVRQQLFRIRRRD